MAKCVLSFLKELVNNRSGRFQICDNKNINSLITFNESAKIVIDFMGCYDNLKGKVVKKDLYTEKLKFIDLLIGIVLNSYSGSYINFATCLYYNDPTFPNLCVCLGQAIVNLEWKDIKVNKFV